MELVLAKLVSKLALPPGLNILLGVAGLLTHRIWPKTSFALIALAVLGLYLFSTPLVSMRLVKGLERYEAVDPKSLPGRVEAIVVLGGAVYENAPEYGTDSISAPTLARLRYAAHLHGATGLPVAVSGGSPSGVPGVGGIMANVLSDELATPVRWLEDASRNTRENAERSRALLEGDGIDVIVLVTHAWHMPRAKRAFEREGFTVVPGPVEFYNRGEFRWTSQLVPQLFALEASHRALHEYLGSFWYWLRERSTS